MNLSGRLRKVAVAAGVLGVLSLGAATVATAVDGGGDEGPRTDRRTPRVGASPSETGFVPIVPCRIFSSVPVGGKFSPGQTRSINKGGNLSGQGGNPAGCGIPSPAIALEVNITAPLAEGNGYIRVWPDASVEQGSTFMNFSNAFNVSNAGTVAVDPGNTDVMDLKVYNARTHVIIDVLGYYIPPMWAEVLDNGTLLEGSGALSATRTSTGRYDVTFNRDVRGCAAQATSSSSQQADLIVVSGSTNSSVGIDSEDPDAADTQFDSQFFVTLTC